MSRTESRAILQVVFHPLTVLAVAVIAAFVFVRLMLLLPRFAGTGRYLLFYYDAPVGVVFVAYLFDRVGRWRQINWKQWIIELPVLALALARTQFPVPLISGHALFLAYAFLTTRSTVARWTAAVVFIEVLCLKILWLDVTLIGGTLVGSIAALVVNRYLRETGDG